MYTIPFKKCVSLVAVLFLLSDPLCMLGNGTSLLHRDSQTRRWSLPGQPSVTLLGEYHTSMANQSECLYSNSMG